ncbi:MAG: zinc-ribbon domain-containing protein [Lentisphaerae bacterium]|nr:zinc-ribbon domain-containing protein [Lentisphaerota bacterium]
MIEGGRLGGAARNCPKCGKPSGDAALFCPSCGSVLQSPSTKSRRSISGRSRFSAMSSARSSAR